MGQTFANLLLGTLAGWACFAVLLTALVVVAQILFGGDPREAPGRSLKRSSWNRYAAAHILVSVAGGLVPLVLVLVYYPPSRIPSVAMLVVVGVVAGVLSLRKKP